MQPSSATRYVAIAPQPVSDPHGQSAAFNHVVAQRHAAVPAPVTADQSSWHHGITRIYSIDEQDAAFNLLALNQQNTAPLPPSAPSAVRIAVVPHVQKSKASAVKSFLPNKHSIAQTKTWYDAAGNVVPEGTPDAMSYTAFARNTYVDTNTGAVVPKGTTGSILKINYDRRTIMVDPQTGKVVPKGTPDAIAQTTYYSREVRRQQPYVDPNTGAVVPKETPGAIKKLSLTNRQHRQKRRTHNRERLHHITMAAPRQLLPRPAAQDPAQQ